MLRHLSVLLGAIALAQQPAIRVNTRLVEVNVVVHDRNGLPVTDLARDEFAIFDQGKPQRIAFFAVNSSITAAAVTAGVGANVYSNRVGAGNVTIILLDGLNTGMEDQKRVRAGVIKFLEQVRPEDRVALYTLGRQVRVLHEFTNSPERLLKAIAKYRERPPTEMENENPIVLDPTGDDDFDNFLQGFQDKIGDVQRTERILLTLHGLEAIANHVAPLNGRKNLVWVSGGFPFTLGTGPITDSFQDRIAFDEDAKRTARAVSDANLAIYPLDAKGNWIDRNLTASSDSRTRQRGPGAFVQAPPTADQNHFSMSLLADRTGGRAFFNTDDVEGAITRAVDDARVTYTLGFYAQGEPDGRSHELVVKVTRKGVEVRYRKAYLAALDSPPAAESWKHQVERAITTPVSLPQIGMDVRVEANTAKPGAYRLVVHLDGPDLPLEHRKDQWVGDVDLEIAQIRADGSVATVSRSPLEIALPEDKFKSVIEDGFRLALSVQPPEGVTVVKVLVLDQAHGRIGSVRVALKLK
jgi:VWFA-related protein